MTDTPTPSASAVSITDAVESIRQNVAALTERRDALKVALAGAKEELKRVEAELVTGERMLNAMVPRTRTPKEAVPAASSAVPPFKPTGG